MAKYDITYSCGHTDTIQFYGKTKDREWKIANEESKLCPECWKKHREEERQKQNAEAAEANQAAGLPELEGTEKQIAWAESIRENMIEAVEKQIFGKMDKEKIKQHPEIYQDFVKAFNALKSHSSASWWIDHRGYDFYSLRRLMEEEIRALKKAESEPPKAIIEEAKAEATVYPEKRITEIVAEISLKDDVLTVSFPERREDFRQLIKDLGYSWGGGAWQRKIKARNGAIEDRAAETGNKLLTAGFPVRIYDETIRKRAIAGEYEPECKRWVQLREIAGEYQGWLAINWDGFNDSLYQAARKIAGARWSKGSMVVPPENYAEVLDFAQMYGFGISEKAQAIIDAARELKEKALTTGVKVPKSAKSPEPGAVPPALDVLDEVEIDKELREDD